MVYQDWSSKSWLKPVPISSCSLMWSTSSMAPLSPTHYKSYSSGPSGLMNAADFLPSISYQLLATMHWPWAVWIAEAETIPFVSIANCTTLRTPQIFRGQLLDSTYDFSDQQRFSAKSTCLFDNCSIGCLEKQGYRWMAHSQSATSWLPAYCAVCAPCIAVILSLTYS